MITRLITAWICNCIDVIATLYFYTYYEGEELNPISVFLLQCPPLFVVVKLLVMTIAVVTIWYKRDWMFCKIASWVLFIEYLLVVGYYMILTIIV